MRIKSQLVGFAAGGVPFTNSDVRIDGELLQPVPIDKGFKHLGITIQMDLGWSSHVAAIGSMIGLFCHGLERHRCPLHIAVSVINQFLIAKIAHRLHFVAPTAGQARKWDTRICRTLSNMCGRRGARAIKTSIWVVVCGLLLPSRYEKMLKISESFLRLNGDPARAWSAQTRWAAIKPTSRAAGNRLVRATKLCEEIGWTMTAVQCSGRWWPSSSLVPSGAASGKTATTNMGDGQRSRPFAIDYHGIWGSELAARWPDTVHMFTDGSWHAPAPPFWQAADRISSEQKRGSGVAAWSVCIVNSWLSDNYDAVGVEGRISEATRKDAFVFGGRMDGSVSQGDYDAELPAIARGLMSIPVGCSCCLHTDSRSSIQSIKAYGSLAVHEYRRRLRMAGRPLLSLITKVMSAKEAAGGVAELRWVKAHANGSTIENVGNRLADDYAGAVCDEGSARALRHKVDSMLPLDLHESFVALRVRNTNVVNGGDSVDDSDSKRGGGGGGSSGRLLTKDPRRAAWQCMVDQCGSSWASSTSQSTYSKSAGSGVDASGLWRLVQQHMPAACGFVMLALANAWQWRRIERVRGGESKEDAQQRPRIEEQRCAMCKDEPVMNVAHLTVCERPMIKRLRENAVDEVTRVLHRAAMEGRRGPTMSEWSLMSVGDERPLRAMVVVFGLAERSCAYGGVTASCIGAFNGGRMKQTLRLVWGIVDGQRRDTIINDLRRPLIKWAFDAAEATKNL